MFKNPSFLFDILCTAAWIVLTVRYARKGFLASMVQLLGNGLSLLGAHQLSSACASWVFEHLLAGGFRTQIAASLAAGGVVDLTGIADKYAGFLPQSLSLIHISEPTRRTPISYAVFCLKKKKRLALSMRLSGCL